LVEEHQAELEHMQDHTASPVERASRAWVEEEGEIFRKGTRLGVAEEEEVDEHQDVSGEELRQEVSKEGVNDASMRRCADATMRLSS
jgi:hypothetical protein